MATDGFTTFDHYDDRLAVALPPGHPLSGSDALRLSNVIEEDFISLERESAVDRLLTEEARKCGRRLRTRIHVTASA